MRLEAALHPARQSKRPGTVGAIHGLGTNMDEGGMYLRLAERRVAANTLGSL